jgi:hypothetical protein
VRLSFFSFLAVVSLLAACGEQENLNPPDQMLRDSLGLTDQDRVHRVVLRSLDQRESIEPTDISVEPGSYLEFLTRDRRVRVVSFVMSELAPEQASFLRSTGQDRSPPLVELDSRFVVSFDGAPEGRYPFLVEGSGAPARGAVSVVSGGRN